MKFIYDHIANDFSIKSTGRVLLHVGESLAGTKSYNNATRTTERLFDHAGNPSQFLPYEFEEDSSVEIMNNIDILYDGHDQEGFRIRLREILADEYSVIVIIIPLFYVSSLKCE